MGQYFYDTNSGSMTFIDVFNWQKRPKSYVWFFVCFSISGQMYHTSIIIIIKIIVTTIIILPILFTIIIIIIIIIILPILFTIIIVIIIIIICVCLTWCTGGARHIMPGKILKMPTILGAHFYEGQVRLSKENWFLRQRVIIQCSSLLIGWTI